jgi:DNA-binding NarL/FixJ family response regulator
MRSSTTLSEVRVLLVDDNEAMLARARTVLTSHCAIVAAVRDGPAALAMAAVLRPDVIILDISLPGMTGFEIARRLRQAGSAAAIVFLTIHEAEEFVLAARNAGGIGYVLKLRMVSDLVPAVLDARAGRPFVSKPH